MKKLLLLVACAGAAFCFSGCKFSSLQDYFNSNGASAQAQKTENPNDPVLVKIDGKPVLRKEEFLEFAEQAMKANPYLASFGITSFESAPEPIRQQLLDAVVQQKLIACWGQAQGIENTAQYKESYAKIIDQLKQALVAQSFDKEIFDTVSVSEDEILAKFDADRDQMIKEPGSVKAVGVSFKSEEKAKVFYDLVAKKEEDTFANLAKESDTSIVDFGTISLDPRKQGADSAPMAVKRSLAALNDKEYYAQARDGEIFWVVQVVDRTKPTYFSFGEVQEQLGAMVKQEKFRAVRDARINEIRGKHTVDVDNSILGSGQDPFAALQQMLAAQGELSPEFLEELETAAQDGEAQG